MNAAPPPRTLVPPANGSPEEGRPVESRLVEGRPEANRGAAAARGRDSQGRPNTGLRRVVDIFLGKVVTLALACTALLLGLATFMVLAGGVWGSLGPNTLFVLVLANLVVLLVLGAALAGRLTRVWVERRRGSAGSRLHIRLVLLFSVVAVVPTILVAVFSTFFFNLVIQGSFNDLTRTALQESLQASRGYLEEHRYNIRADALGMANDLSRAGSALSGDPSGFAPMDINAFGQFLGSETELRGLTEAVIYDPDNSQVMASVGVVEPLASLLPPAWANQLARTGDVAVLGSEDSTRVRAVVQLTPMMNLLIGRPVDPSILEHVARTEQAVAQYKRLDDNRTDIQIQFALIFMMIALVVLCSAALIGLVLANQIARPIGRLIAAAERVRAGDLAVRVPEAPSGDEVGALSRAFNRMTGQLAAQRSELMDAYSQLDERRRFTEAVLSGVSAGVIGLDTQGRIELPNRAAGELLGVDLMAAVGRPLQEVVPDFAPLLASAREAPDRPRTDEVQIGPIASRRTLLVRIGADRRMPRPEGQKRSFGFVATFDDITALQSAQRKAAWADVARRIAHEIKNPLTPIQLSAERLKRRFAKEITSDPETFAQCADTIVRQVGDIGRMVDEFSSFARMPHPVIKEEDVGRIAREALVLQRNARPQIEWITDIPERGPIAPCDRRLIGQALTNLLANAADAVAMKPRAAGAAEADPAEAADPARKWGRIAVAVLVEDGEVRISVADDGIGLPDDRARLTEPYVTHKPKGTGLGLAIVKKIMEDHDGRLMLEDRAPRDDWGGVGTAAALAFPAGSAGDAATDKKLMIETTASG